MADKKTIEDLLTDEIKDLYSAEKQLTKAIPKMAKGSNDEKLRAAFRAHLEETRAQVDRLEQVAKFLASAPPERNALVWKAASRKAPKRWKKRGTRRSSILALSAPVHVSSIMKWRGI